ncbi:MAG: DapH/DapD/GlmU-related protein [Ilumatobacter sp.]
MLNVDCTLELNDCVTIGADAALGHGVMVLTSSHDLGRHTRRAGRLHRRPVTIGAGAWIGANSVILPGVTVGDGAVVMSNSVVNDDVPADSLVAGAPATIVVRRLPK